jgi:phenylalanyl-tRNA synthetase beta chain
MKISFDWLKEFVDIPDDAHGAGRRLTDVGLALDGIETRGGDTILELDVTANRGDCLSPLGVAREAAAIYDLPLRLPDRTVSGSRTGDPGIAVGIGTPGLCGRYTARVILGVRVAPSPDWIVRRLAASGIRAVNNVADITNYVLLELGHPLHAFDLGRLGSREILVRTADNGESLETLDGVSRALDAEMLVITNGSRPVALAGVMGGAESEITDETTDILLESAWFDAGTVRRTARKLNLGTEASYRFERGTDPEMALLASDRATRLILELAGGEIAGEQVDVYPGRKPPRVVTLRRQSIPKILGAPIPDAEVRSIFERLAFRVGEDAAGWTVTVPLYRNDIEHEEDLLEEVARHYGYERFPPTLPAWAGEGRGLARAREERAARDALRGLGYSEACTLAFSDPDTERRFAPDLEPTALRNPLSGDDPVLRSTLVPGILRAVLWNLNRGVRDVRLYEIGKVYPTSGESTELVMAATGSIRPPSVHGPPLESGFFALKGDLESLLSQFGVDCAPGAEGLPAFLHPGRSLALGEVAVFGQLDPGVERDFRIRQSVCVALVKIERLWEAGLRTVAVRPVPKYPRIRRDFSLLIDRGVRFADIVSAIRKAGIAELVAVFPFDRLERGPFPESCYSLAITLEYQSVERTLTDSEVEEYDRLVLSRLDAVGVRLRS